MESDVRNSRFVQNFEIYIVVNFHTCGNNNRVPSNASQAINSLQQSNSTYTCSSEPLTTEIKDFRG